LGFDLFVFKKEDFEKNPYLERDLRNIFKILNKENKNVSIYDLKYYYLFLYNIYIEKKIILPIFYLNEKEIEENDSNKVDDIKNLISFNSLFNRYNIEIYRNNNINLIYNTYLYSIKNDNIILDSLVEKKIKNQVIFNYLIKNYLKCNKITFLVLTELL
jgi:hypothetical protein